MTHTSKEQHDSIDAFIQMAAADGFDVAHNFYEGKGWVFFNPATADIWKYWKAAQAQRAPLDAEAVQKIMKGAGYSVWDMKSRADFINGIRHGEAAHGITQEQP